MSQTTTFPSAVSLYASLSAALSAIPLGPDYGDEKLFERVELYGNASLARALADLVITEGRVCLVVPTAVRRLNEAHGTSVMTRRFLQVDLLIADRAFYQAPRAAVFGGDRNAGVIEMGELVERALAGIDLSEYGPAIFEDGVQQTLTSEERKTTPGRETWVQTLLLPAGSVQSDFA